MTRTAVRWMITLLVLNLSYAGLAEGGGAIGGGGWGVKAGSAVGTTHSSSR